jgi:hypothetical protein
MCYGALLDGEVERPLRQLVRGELWSAGKVGAGAALAVLVVLLGDGVGPALAAGAALGALCLGAALHQAVFLAGVGVLRVWGASTDPTGGETP